MVFIVRASIFACLLALLVASSLAQGMKHGFAGDFYILDNVAAVTDMGLTTKQVELARKIAADFEQAIQTKGEELEREESLDSSPFTFMRIHEQYRDKLKDVFSPDQWRRFNQLSIQIPGPTKLLQPKLQADLGFTAEQKAQVSRLSAGLVMAWPDGDEEARNESVRRYNETLGKLLNILTPRQKELFDKMQGKPLQKR